MNEVPVLVYDGTCGFCRRVVGWIRRRAGNRLSYLAGEKASPEVRLLSSRAVLLSFQGEIHQGAKAVYKAGALLGATRAWNLYQGNRPFALLSEGVYRVISLSRPFISFFLDLLLGPPPEDL